MGNQWLLAGVFLVLTNGASAMEHCTASHYGHGDGLQGSRTATGTRFNTHATDPYTMAHKTLRFGTMARVCKGARCIIAKVTDRGPFVRGRCVDLGIAGARAIGMGGTARVTVEALPR